MIMREAIRELASFESPEGCAVSFYYQPRTPQNKSHKEEAILVKDLARNVLAERAKHGKNGHAREDLERIVAFAERLKGNHARGKAVFACGARGIWKEFDLPSQLRATQLVVNTRFHLKPLTAMLASPRCYIVLADRERARLFDLWMDHFAEVDNIFDEIPRRGRSDGFQGYDAGHNERRIEVEAIRHFKRVAERLQQLAVDRSVNLFIIGCRDETWPEFSAQLHTYVKQRVIGRFSVDPATASGEEVREKAERILEEYEADRRQGLIREVLGEAQRNGRGALGLRNVLRSMSQGEVQTMLIAEGFSGRGIECRNCGHLDSRLVRNCPICGHEARELDDMADILIATALRSGIEIVHVPGDPAFEKAGQIAALLRFRADQNTPNKLAV